MSVLDGLEFLPETAARPDAPAGDTRPEPGLLEQFGAAMRVQAETTAEVLDERKGAAYRPLIDALVESGVSREYLMRGGDLVAGADVASAAQDYNYDTVYREAQRRGLTGTDGTALPPRRADFELRVLRRDGGRDRDQDTLARGAGVDATLAQFMGGMVGSFRDPVNLVTLPFGGGGTTAARRIASEALVSAAGAAVALPGTANAYDRLGEDFTAGDAALEVGFAAAGGAGLRGGIELAPKVDAAAYRVAASLRERFDRFFADRDAARALAQAVPEHLRTPEQSAALRVLAREAEIDDTSPYTRTIGGDAAHRARLAEAAEQLASAGGPQRGPGALNTTIVAFFRGKGYSDGQARGIAAGIHAESAANPAALNPASGAFGIGQWLGPRKAELFRRYGPQPSLGQQLEFLHWELQGGDHGGASVIGAFDETDVLRRYITDFMRPAAGAETSGDLSRGMAALGRDGEALPGGEGNAWAGVDAGADVPVIRPEALDAERPFVSSAADVPEVRRDLFPDDASWRLARGEFAPDSAGLPSEVTRQTVWEAARDKLTAERAGEVPGALYHPALGPIDVRWGDAAGGLAHISAKHPEVLDRLPELIEAMEVVKQSANRVQLESLDHRAGVRLDFDGRAQQWLLTAFRKKEPSPPRKAPSPAEDRGVGDTARDRSPELEANTNIRSDGLPDKAELALHGRIRAVADAADFPADQLLENFNAWRARDGDAVAMRLLEDKESEFGLQDPAPADATQATQSMETTLFDDDAGEGIRLAAESDWHDVRAAIEAKALPEQLTFDLEDLGIGRGKGPLTAAEIDAEIAAERAGLEEIRKCLK